MPFTAAEGGQGDSPAEKKGICCNKITIKTDKKKTDNPGNLKKKY